MRFPLGPDSGYLSRLLRSLDTNPGPLNIARTGVTLSGSRDDAHAMSFFRILHGSDLPLRRTLVDRQQNEHIDHHHHSQHHEDATISESIDEQAGNPDTDRHCNRGKGRLEAGEDSHLAARHKLGQVRVGQRSGG